MPMDSLARALALKFIKGKADLVDGKVPSDQLPSYVSNIVEVETYADLPAQGETDTIYVVKTPAVTTYRWTGSSYIVIDEKAQYYSVKVSSTNIITMGDLRNYINNVNSTGLHCLFDFSDFINNAYVCTVLCFTQNAVNYCVIFDIINGRTYVDYAGYQDNEAVQAYVNRLGDNIPRVISITDANTKVQDIIDLLGEVNVVGHHILFDFHTLQAGCYLCTVTYNSNNIVITDVVGCKVVRTTFDANTLLSTVLSGMGELVDLTSAQTITGAKTFSDGAIIRGGNKSFKFVTDNNGLRCLYQDQYLKFAVTNTSFISNVHFIPLTSATYDIGSSAARWRDIYLSGNITDGTNSVSVADISNGLFNVINASDIPNNTFTQAQVNLLLNGKLTRIITSGSQEFLSNRNCIIFNCFLDGANYYGSMSCIASGRNKIIGFKINSSTLVASLDNVRMNIGIGNINNKAIPNYPTDTTKKYMLVQQVGGTLAWEEIV